jgi:hypothetical protein
MKTEVAITSEEFNELLEKEFGVNGRA